MRAALRNTLRFAAWLLLTLFFGWAGARLPAALGAGAYTGPADGFTILMYGTIGLLVGGVAAAAIVGWLTERTG